MDVVLIGGFQEVFEALEENSYSIKGYIDSKTKKVYNNFNWLGTDIDAVTIKKKYPNTQIIITPDNPSVRSKLYTYYKSINFNICRFIHIDAKISASVEINEGVFIQKMVNISSNSVIGKMVKINISANIMHDCLIGDFTTIAPNAVILGNVNIGSRCYIGANSTILPNLQITNDVIIGAGSVVTKSIMKKGTYVGIPAKKL